MITDLTEVTQNKEVIEIETAISELEKNIIKVIDDATNDQASKTALVCKEYLDKLEEKRTSAKEPFLKAGREIDAFFKPITTRLTTLRSALTKSMGAYYMQKEEERRKQEEKNAKKIEKAIEKGKPMPVVTQIVNSPQVRTDEGLTSIRKVWKCEVLDLAKVPDQYIIKTVDMKKIDFAVKSGVREIPGCRVYEDAQIIQRNN